ncbi:MAG: spore protease YyaC [Firmicutes bacterium]|nr:spore protease YyaC [Bacillota bacterium]
MNYKNNFENTLNSLLRETANNIPVILCIGSDRVIGDALGPLVGHMLTSLYNVGVYVYGSLANPVTALNLSSAIDFIKRRHPKSKVIAIDSSIGDEKEIGLIKVNKGGIYPGSAVGKSLPYVGDISITAIVSHRRSPAHTLGNVRLGLVHSLASQISASLNQSLKQLIKKSA